jgi:hypothetical protein
MDTADASRTTRIVALPRPPLWKRWSFWFVIAVVSCLAFAAGRNYVGHLAANRNLQSTLADLDRSDPGWRLADLEAARKSVDEAANSANRLQEADDLLPKKWWYQGLYERLVKLPPGDPPTIEDIDTLREKLDERPLAVAKGRELADLPNGRFPIRYQRNGHVTPGLHIESVLRIADVMFFDAIVRAEAGDVAGASRSACAILNSGRALGDEPLQSTQFLRVACTENACRAIERALSHGELDAESLRRLQLLLEDEVAFPRLSVMVRGNRAVIHEFLDAVEAGDEPVASLSSLTGSANRLGPPSSVEAVRAAHPEVLRTLSDAVAIADLPGPKRAERIDLWETALKNSPEGTVLVAAVPDLRSLDTRCRHIDGRLRCLIAALAAERYRLQHGEWPAGLSDLTPKFLASVPTDPTTGEPLGYFHSLGHMAVFARPNPSVTVDRALNLRIAPDPDGVVVQLLDPKKRHRHEKVPPPTP